MRRYCDECGAELRGAHALNGGANLDRLVGSVDGPLHSPVEIQVLLRRKYGADLCRPCLVDAVSRWVEAERRAKG